MTEATELAARLRAGQPGGLVTLERAPASAAVADLKTKGVRVAWLDGPTSREALFAELDRGLRFPSYFGRNWDALIEVLAFSDPVDDRPVLLIWHDPAALDAKARRRSGRSSRTPPASDMPQRSARCWSSRWRRAVSTPFPSRSARMGKIHHVALIVSSIEDALGLWRDMLGLELETVMDIPQDRVRIAFLGVGESKVELVEPTDDTTGVARFLASKGEGFHHVCFEVKDLSETLLRLGIDGLELIDSAPRRGAEGPGRVPAPALVPGRAGRADRGARWPVLGRPRVLGEWLGRPEREHQGQLTLDLIRQPEVVGRPLHQEVRTPGQERVLDEGLDAQAGIDERGHDLAEAVVPAVLDDALADIGRGVGVGAGHLEAERVAVLPVRVVQAEFAWRDALVLEGLVTGWASVMKKMPPGARKCATTRGPRADIRQPAKDAARGVDDVEGPVEVGRQVVQVRLDEPRLREAQVRRQRRRQLDGRRRQVRAGDASAESRERQRVDPEVALQVEEGLAGDVADELELVRLDPAAALSEGREVVEVALGMDPGPDVPQPLVGGDRPRLRVSITAGTRRTGRPELRPRVAAEPDDLAGEVADPGLLLARQLPSSSSTRSIQRPAMRVDGSRRRSARRP